MHCLRILRGTGIEFDQGIIERREVQEWGDLFPGRSNGGPAGIRDRRKDSIVEVLVHHVGRVVTREHLTEAIWGDPDALIANSLEVLIARIRRKLAGEAERLETVRGVGYRLSP